ncbi:hypothetical protein ABPG72_006242 [Tetrahymena utriculariae]
MLTFGDSQTEPSSTEEEKKLQIKNQNKSKQELNKNYTRELTRDSDEQEQQVRAQSDINSEQTTIDIVKDLSKGNNSSNEGVQENYVNRNETKSLGNNQQVEASLSQQTIKLNIMSPKVNRQIQYANFENLTIQQNKKEVVQAKHSSREDISQNSNMIKREIHQQHNNSSSDLLVDDFSIGNSIFQFITLQLIIVFEIMSTMLVSSIFFSEDMQYSLILYISLFFLTGLISIFLTKIQRVRKYLMQIMTLMRFIVLVIYVEGRVIGIYSSLERNINNQIKSQVNHAIEMLSKDKQQQVEQSITYQLLNSRFLFTQLIYIGCLVICLIQTIHKTASNFLGSTINAILTILTILYVQLRFCDFSEISLVQISLTFFLVVTVFISWLFQNYIVYYFCKDFGTQKNILGIQNQIQNSNLNPSFVVSPRFGEMLTNQQNDVKQEQIVNHTLKALSIQMATRLYGINYKNESENESENERQSGHDLDNCDNNNNAQNIQNLNFLSPKNSIGSLQIITPRDELDSKREMYNEIQKQGMNTQQEQFSPTCDNDNNIQYNKNRQDNCQNDVFFKAQSNQKIGSDAFNHETYQNDNQPNQESMRKSINFYDEQIADNTQFEKQMQENYSNNEEYDIQENEQPDQSLFDGDKSDIKEVTDSSTIQINRNKKELSPVQVEAQESEEQAKWKIHKQARDALQVRKQLAQQQSKLKVYNNMIQKNGLEKQILDLEQRLEMQDMILNNISNGIIIIQKDTNEVVYVNKQACQNLNCSLEQVFNTLMSLKNVNTLKDKVQNFSELLQQFDHPIQLSQLSTLKGLFINHEKQREIMICIKPDAFQSNQNQLISQVQKNFAPDSSMQSNQVSNYQKSSDKNATNFTLKNYLDSAKFLQIEVDQVRNQKERYMIFNINVITWSNPYNIIHTTTLKVQYFIRKMISELSLDINDIREYFQALNNQYVQKLDCNGCIGKVDCMSEFLQDFATSSLLISSTFIPIKQQLNLLHLIQNVLEKMKIRTSQKQYYFSLQYDSVCPSIIYSDVKRLDRVFYNLILYFIDTNDKAFIKIKVLPSFSNNSSKKQLKVQISCSKSQSEETPTNSYDNQAQKKKKNSGVKFSLSQKRAQITNVYMLENMHYGVLLSNSIIQKLEPDDQGIIFQSGQNISFTFLLSV